MAGIAALAAAFASLTGCAPSDTPHPLHNSTTLTPPENPGSQSAPTSGQANADPHAFVE